MGTWRHYIVVWVRGTGTLQYESVEQWPYGTYLDMVRIWTRDMSGGGTCLDCLELFGTLGLCQHDVDDRMQYKVMVCAYKALQDTAFDT